MQGMARISSSFREMPGGVRLCNFGKRQAAHQAARAFAVPREHRASHHLTAPRGGVPIAPPRGTRPFDGRFGNVDAGPAGLAASAGGSVPTCSRFWSSGPVLRSISLSACPSRRCSRRPLGAWPDCRPCAGWSPPKLIGGLSQTVMGHQAAHPFAAPRGHPEARTPLRLRE